ncbi:hypothetical protein PFTANZ_04946 [Plasmodium falciparum Tanzania (2000708)]|uniref:Surface antigen n=1 Tax=Plasmodium falciparum Tanzania (2000708) TaxID=1036725 RepID=A0A024W1B3_PLAFA|nr:hypothetical protein PFTANZ_04946 [Plasmodium falciparum Tanzania (2000708)]
MIFLILIQINIKYSRLVCGMFVKSFNIVLDHIKNKLSIITRHIPTTRLLCECELYAPANYDNDPQIKELMDNFNKQTQQRFHEYDERMKTTRQKCRERCVKEIQKIILKDKLEKQMAEQLTTLETKIDTDDIPTCICEKSLEDKMEKECLKCGYGLGTVAPTVGLIGSVAVNAWKTTEIAAATKAAIDKGLALGKIAGDIEGATKLIKLIESTFDVQNIAGQPLVSYFTTTPFNKASIITEALFNEYLDICLPIFTGSLPVRGVRYNISSPICTFVNKGMVARVGIGVSPKNFIKTTVEEAVAEGTQAAETEAAKVAAAEKAAILETSKKAIETTSYNWYTTIGYSITAILIIVLIMVIIYKILRYRRKYLYIILA